MRMVIVSVYDVAVGAYGRPAFVRTEAEAVRSFSDEVNRPGEGNAMHAHPEHFSLFALGFFDDQEGLFVPGDAKVPRCLVTAGSLKVRQE